LDSEKKGGSKMRREGGETFEKTWHTEDLDFDEYGRLVIKNKSLQKAFMEKILGETKAGMVKIQGIAARDIISRHFKNEGMSVVNCHCGILGPNCPDIPWPDGGGCIEVRPDMQVRFIQTPEHH
jgi:hypothetical protein